MSFLKNKPDLLFLGAGISTIILSYVPSGKENNMIDVKLHHTYFVLEHSSVICLFGIYLAFCASLYFIFKYTLGGASHYGGGIHFLLTVGVAACLYTLPVPILQPKSIAEMYMVDRTYNAFYLFLWGCLFVSQVLLPFNLGLNLYLAGTPKKAC